MSDLDPNRFANVNGERKRERLVHAHPLGKIKSTSTDRQVEREREREREMCVLFDFRHFFFNSENSSTYFKVSCISLQKILIDEMSLSDCITL